MDELDLILMQLLDEDAPLTKQPISNIVEAIPVATPPKNNWIKNGGNTKQKKLFECAACLSLIQSGGTMYAGKAYHTEHFVCCVTTCGKNLAGLICHEHESI
jgi:hypothetical protein